MNHDALARHHEDLDRRIERVLTSAASGDAHDLRQEWSGFERELLNHFDVEEREIIPSFMRENPEEAAALAQEHVALRRDLLALGIGADLHTLRAEAVRAFVTDLRAHAAREERVLYAWAREHLDRDAWTAIGEALRAAGRLVARGLSELGGRTL
ncbi:MAG TPA: hemerythrin domain-containing protein [Polyangia bacterium]|nr:hemerythrin domain-containing protein [Polyangia bacterium]